MHRRLRTLALASLASIVFIAATEARAAAPQRTFVASYGSDVNPCSPVQPCRTFGQAIGVTNAGGEVIVLDSAGYGPVTITQSVSIIAPAGVYAGITVLSGNGVTVVAGANDAITLRGISITAQGGSGGVSFQAGAKLVVERCTITGGFATGIAILGPLDAQVFVRNSEIGGATLGIDVGSPGGESIQLVVNETALHDIRLVAINLHANVSATIANSQLIGHGGSFWGVNVQGGNGYAVKAHVTKSVISKFASGLHADDTAPTASGLSVADSEVSNNSYGAETRGAATMALAGNRFLYNYQSTVQFGGPFQSSGTNFGAYNNFINGNF